MVRRKYQQACPVAFSLDLIGERWTLLILRDLLLGPLRFSDFVARLPGIGRNLVATRLKEMTRDGLIRRHALEPPAASQVYALTSKGRGLEPALLSLAAWGLRYGGLQALRDGHTEPDLIGLAFKLAFDPTHAAAAPPLQEIVANGRPLHVRVRGGEAQVSRGPVLHPDIRVTGELPTLAALLFDPAFDAAVARRDGQLGFEGSGADLPRFLALFGALRRPA